MNYSRDGLAKNIVGMNNPMQGALVRLVRLSLLGCLFGYFWVGNLVLLGEQPTVAGWDKSRHGSHRLCD